MGRLVKNALWLGSLLAVVTFASAIPALAEIAGPGEVGGPATRHLGRPDEGKQTTPTRIIGVGRTYDGWLEIDAYGWRPPADVPGERQELCTWIEFQATPSPNYGSCLGVGEIGTIAIESIAETLKPKQPQIVYLGGAVAPDVARVEITIKRPGLESARRIEATVALVSGELQRQLRQSSPFGYFFAKVRGLVPTKDICATAYSASDRKLGSTRGLSAQGGEGNRERRCGRKVASSHPRPVPSQGPE